MNLVGSLREAVTDARIAVLVARWAEFSQLTGLLNELGQRPLVVDARRVLDPGSFAHYRGYRALGDFDRRPCRHKH